MNTNHQRYNKPTKNIKEDKLMMKTLEKHLEDNPTLERICGCGRLMVLHLETQVLVCPKWLNRRWIDPILEYERLEGHSIRSAASCES